MNRQYPCLIFLLILFSSLFYHCGIRDSFGNRDKRLQAKVTFLKGNTYLLRENTPGKVKLKLGDMFIPSDVIITGKNSELNVSIVERGILKIKENSHVALKNFLMIDEDNSLIKLQIRIGKLIIGLKKLQKDSIFEVETPTAVVGVRGTTFMVSVNQRENNAFPYFVKTDISNLNGTRIAALTGFVRILDKKDITRQKFVKSLEEIHLSTKGLNFSKKQVISIPGIYDIWPMKNYEEISSMHFESVAREIIDIEPEIYKILNSGSNINADENEQNNLLKSREEIQDENMENTEIIKEKIKKLKIQEKSSQDKYLEDDMINW